MATDAAAAILGLLLLFVLPGAFTTRALFPEWRFGGPAGALHLVEAAALSLLLSVAYTVLIGAALLNGPGFSATWSNPSLEIALGVVSIAGAGIAWARGGFRRTAPAAPPLEPSSGEEDAWARIREQEALARQARRLRHALRTTRDGPEAERLRAQLAELGSQVDALRAEREAEVAG